MREEMTAVIFYSGSLNLHETTKVPGRMLLIAFTQLGLEVDGSSCHITGHPLPLPFARESNLRSSDSPTKVDVWDRQTSQDLG